MKHHYREIKLGPSFTKDSIEQIKGLIDKSVPIVVAGMPGVGVSTFLRYLSTKDFAHFIYIDTFNLTSLFKKELFNELLKQLDGRINSDSETQILEECQNILAKLANKSRVVIIFNRFDQLKKEFDNILLSNIRSLRMVNPDKITFIFTGNRPYSDILPKDITSDNFHILNKTVYLKPFSMKDLKELLTITVKTPHDNNFIEKALTLSGGHYQLLQLFLKSESLEDPLLDRFIKYQLKELIDFVNYPQKKIIQKIAFGKDVNYVNPYLIDIGLVIKNKRGYKLFTPLLQEYLLKNIPLRLPKKESKLFKLLLRNIESIVSKDEIFQTVWKDAPEDATDWALNALIYRLRKNPGFASSDYIIENLKKEGFILYKG